MTRSKKKVKTFKHSGDLGDIIYSLPAIRASGGGILLLDTSGGADEFWCKRQCIDGKTKFNERAFAFVKPLIDAQDYIVECREFVPGEKVDVNLNDFRQKFSDPKTRSKNHNLVDLHLDFLNLPELDHNEGWLTATEKLTPPRKIVVARSPRIQRNYPWFQSNKFLLRDQACFLGLDKEHEIFEWVFGIEIPLLRVDNALEMLNYISGCELFIGNSSFPLALAIGLGNVNIIQEYFETTIFQNKKNMQYV